jgi:hypothetical protein
MNVLTLMVMANFAIAYAAQAVPSSFSFFNATLLSRSASLIASHDPRVMSAYNTLLLSANTALTYGPYSVTQKYNASLIPFICDPQDYVSVGYYLWPCTMTPPGQVPLKNTSGCNETTGLPWIYWDGIPSPYVDSFDLRIMQDTINNIQTLSFAYFFSNNETFAQRATLLIRTWFTDSKLGMLPNLDHAQFSPGVNTGSGGGIIDIDEYFATGFLDTLTMLRPSLAWTSSDEKALQGWMSEYLNWLITSPLSNHEREMVNNHRTFFDAQLLQLAAYTRNASVAINQVPLEYAVLDEQIAANGMLFEEVIRTNSQHYVSFCLHAYMGLATGASFTTKTDLWNYKTRVNASSILTAITYIMPYSNGSQIWPFENLDEPTWSDFFDVYRLAATVYPLYSQEFLVAAETTINATSIDDVKRLLWFVE